MSSYDIVQHNLGIKSIVQHPIYLPNDSCEDFLSFMKYKRGVFFDLQLLVSIRPSGYWHPSMLIGGVIRRLV
jgi:hypothetical protein